jgi:hypothetical protein
MQYTLETMASAKTTTIKKLETKSACREDG